MVGKGSETGLPLAEHDNREGAGLADRIQPSTAEAVFSGLADRLVAAARPLYQ